MCRKEWCFLCSLAVLSLSSASGSASGCEVLGKFNMQRLFKPGDITIGGIFPVSNKQEQSNISYMVKPPDVSCVGFDLRAFRWTQVMIFAIEEINEDNLLLPNISLGYRILDSCASPTNVLRAAVTLVSRSEDPGALCPPVAALIAESGSSQSLAVASTLGPFRVPTVSYFSTCACLSDREKYPTFFRTIPSDFYQAKALAALVRRFGWTWIGALHSDNDYGRNGVLAFTKEVQKQGVCIAFVGTVLRTYTRARILDVVDTIKQSMVKVILAFVPEGDLYPLMQEVVLQNITGIQWIASEAWITAARPSTPEIYRSFGGTIGFVVRKAAIPRFEPFLRGISPYVDSSAGFIRDFWEIMAGCRPLAPGKVQAAGAGARDVKWCSGTETLAGSSNVFFNVSQLRVAYNVYNAVYAIAHALHNLIFCQAYGESPVIPCVNVSQIQPKQVSDQLQKVKLTNPFGEAVFFDKNGDPPPSYDIINWQLTEGQVDHVTVGHFGSASDGSYKLSIQEEDIVWGTGHMIPTAACSAVCPPGTRKAQVKGRPVCCFDCIPCPEGTIANSTGAVDCDPCPREYWSNKRRDNCIQKTIEFLSYSEPMGIALTVISLLGACLSLATMSVYIHYRDTPVIKASNFELSSLLLFSLFMCFLCPLPFLGKPTTLTCMLRHTAFGVTFALCISCILGKTIIVVTAFRATLPGSNMAGKFGPAQQRVIVCSCTFVQIFICVLWLNLNPPFADKVFRYSNKKIVLECNPGSEVAFYAVLGYIGFLAGTCLVLAFLARKLPDNFNEAKFITFSMLIFCAVWITFIPSYVSSPGKVTVAVEIFAILSSAFGLLICIFAPKCYIIFMKPEHNTKKHVMRKNPPRKVIYSSK